MKNLKVSTKILIGLMAGIVTLGAVLFITIPDDFKDQIKSHSFSIHTSTIEMDEVEGQRVLGHGSFRGSKQHGGGQIAIIGGVIFICYLAFRKKKEN